MSKFIVMQLELYYNKADILFHGGGGKQTQMCLLILFNWRGFPGGSVVKNLPVNARDAGVIKFPSTSLSIINYYSWEKSALKFYVSK